MNTIARVLIVSSLLVAQGLATAGPRHHGHYNHHRHHHHHHHQRGVGLGGLVLGLAVAVPLIALANQAQNEAPRQPEVVYVPPPATPTYVPARPAPVIYPRNGQAPEHLEADSRECNRWATTQPAAMADASIFHRAVEACMDGRGYTVR